MLKLFAIFTLLFYIGILLSRDPGYFTGRTTQGTIIGMGKKYVPGGKGHGTIEPFPIVAFSANGQTYRLADEKSTYLFVGTIGDHVKYLRPTALRQCSYVLQFCLLDKHCRFLSIFFDNGDYCNCIFNILQGKGHLLDLQEY